MATSHTITRPNPGLGYQKVVALLVGAGNQQVTITDTITGIIRDVWVEVGGSPNATWDLELKVLESGSLVNLLATNGLNVGTSSKHIFLDDGPVSVSGLLTISARGIGISSATLTITILVEQPRPRQEWERFQIR